MSDPAITSRLTRDSRPDITLPNGRILTPRARLAKEVGVAEKTIARKNSATVYVGGVAYVDRDSALNDIAKGLRRRNEPAKKRRGPPTKAAEASASSGT